MKRWPVVVTGIVLGVGLAGLLDGILFRQILQWHHILSDAGSPETVEVDILADGVFAALMWILTAGGIAGLWRTRRDPLPGRALGGLLLIGAGLYLLVEGLIAHYLLGLHHVKPGPGQGFWDFFFLLIGVGLMIVGLALALSRLRIRYDEDAPVTPVSRPPDRQPDRPLDRPADRQSDRLHDSTPRLRPRR